jgi:hypothetical protein
MKKIALFLTTALLVTSCSISNQMSQHPSVKPCGKKSHKNSQSNLSTQYCGANYNQPNRFKKTHF